METNKPFDKIRISNGIEITFWEKEILKGNQKIKMLDVSINKSWKNKKGEWEQRKIGCNLNDIYRLISVGSKIKDVEDKFHDLKREEPEEIVM